MISTAPRLAETNASPSPTRAASGRTGRSRGCWTPSAGPGSRCRARRRIKRGMHGQQELARTVPLGSGAMKVLVTGGAGYIGSITAKALEEAGHTPGHPRLPPHRAAGVRPGPDLLRGRHRRPRAARADRRGAPRHRVHDPHGGADRGPGVGGEALRVLPRQRRQVAGAVRRARSRLGKPRVVFSSARPSTRSPRSSRSTRTRRSPRRRRTPAPSG